RHVRIARGGADPDQEGALLHRDPDVLRETSGSDLEVEVADHLVQHVGGGGQLGVAHDLLAREARSAVEVLHAVARARLDEHLARAAVDGGLQGGEAGDGQDDDQGCHESGAPALTEIQQVVMQFHSGLAPVPQGVVALPGAGPRGACGTDYTEITPNRTYRSDHDLPRMSSRMDRL